MVLGAAAGDIVGSIYEGHPIKTTEFELLDWRARFTDDTVLTMATAYAVLNGASYADAYRQFARRYPNAGYGGSFRRWFMTDGAGSYNSFGNGSAMRVSPVGWAFETEEEVLEEAEKSAACTHSHPEGVRGAQATALAVFLARSGSAKEEIAAQTRRRFGYDLNRSVDGIRPGYRFDVTCQGSVPESIIAFLESDSVEHSIRLAVSLGGDTDTQACIAASIAHAFFGSMSGDLEAHVRERLPEDLLRINDEFCRTYVGS
jgi:ADP-ribosylglycohydrolase